MRRLSVLLSTGIAAILLAASPSARVGGSEGAGRYRPGEGSHAAIVKLLRETLKR